MKKLLLSASLLFTILLFTSGLYAQTVVTNETSSPNACDGSAWLADSSSINETTVYWSGGGTVLQQGGFYITNLCPGTYTVTYTDGFFGNVTYTFTISSSSDPCANFYVTYTSTEPTSALNCDGAIVANVSGGTAPYTYFWSTGTTSPGMSDLCAGNYECVVTDANGCSSTIFCEVGGANTTDSTLIFDNNPYPDSLIVDTLGNTWIEDCLIDFLSIDSAYVGGIANISADTILLNWVLVDTNGLVVLDLLVPYINPNGVAGVYQVSMTIFCPQRAGGVNTLMASDQVYFESMSLGITEENHNLFTVSNPFNESIQLTFTEIGNYAVELVDLNGKILSSVYAKDSMEIKFNSSNLNSGMYLINVSSESGKSSKKILKL